MNGARAERPIIFSGPMVRAILAGKKTQTRRVIDMQRLRVKLRRDVQSDFAKLDPSPLSVAKGEILHASLNPQGAVSVDVGGRLLGLRPGEFDFVCPFASGPTHLARMSSDHAADVWMLTDPATRLWVKETFAWSVRDPDSHAELGDRENYDPVYRADAENVGEWEQYEEGKIIGKTTPTWRSPLFLPRWASRIELEVTRVRCDRVQAITDEDARAEGVEPIPCEHADGVPIVCAMVGCLGPHFRGYARQWDDINGKRAPWASNPWVWVVEFRRAS